MRSSRSISKWKITLAAGAVALLIGMFQNCSPGFQSKSISNSSQGLDLSQPGSSEPNATPPKAVPFQVTPVFASETILFEDNVLSFDTAVPPMVYRLEGDAWSVDRVAESNYHVLRFKSGRANYVHAAKYNRATLRVTFAIDGGTPTFNIAHNGFTDQTGAVAVNLGLSISMTESKIVIVDASAKKTVATFDYAFPRGSYQTFGIAWNTETRTIRLDLPENKSLTARLPDVSIPRGGFSIFAEDSSTKLRVKKIQVVWQDPRPILFYDGFDSLVDEVGTFKASLPSAAFADGLSHGYATIAYDLQRNRSLVVYRKQSINGEIGIPLDLLPSLTAMGVRELSSGAVTDVATPKGCQGGYAGGGFDGYWLVIGQIDDPRNPMLKGSQNLCQFDWGLYDQGKVDEAYSMVSPATYDASGTSFTGSRPQDLNLVYYEPSTFTGYYDPSVALDGSIIRYGKMIRSGPSSYIGQNHFAPTTANFANMSFKDVVTPPSAHPDVYLSGGASYPSSIAIRDLDKLYYEEWPIWSTKAHLHTRNVGISPFSNLNSALWATEDFYSATTSYGDWANLVPSLLQPGYVYAAPKIIFDPRNSSIVEPVGLERLQVGDNTLTKVFGQTRSYKNMQIPFDPDAPYLRPDQSHLPAGRYTVEGNAAIYHASGEGYLCSYSNVEDYIKDGGRANFTNVTKIKAIPAGTVSSGACVVK